MEYEWDEAKRLRNLAKHGIDFAQVHDFDWETAVRFEDIRKLYGEQRWLALGVIGSRLHALIYTTRGHRIRVISLRKARNQEAARRETTP